MYMYKCLLFDLVWPFIPLIPAIAMDFCIIDCILCFCKDVLRGYAILFFKKEPIGLLREISAKLRHAFPTGNEYEVKDLFEKLFDCLQVSCCYVPYKPYML